MSHSHKHMHGWSSFHYRTSLPTSDFDEVALTQDNDWHYLDLSSIIPADTKLILLSISITDATLGSFCRFSDDTRSEDQCTCRILVVNQKAFFQRLVPVTDEQRRISYFFNEAFTQIDLLILGWFQK